MAGLLKSKLIEGVSFFNTFSNADTFDTLFNKFPFRHSVSTLILTLKSLAGIFAPRDGVSAGFSFLFFSFPFLLERQKNAVNKKKWSGKLAAVKTDVELEHVEK